MVDWVWDRWKEGVVFDVMDFKLKGDFEEMEVVMLMKLGLMCFVEFFEVWFIMK